jgi:acyl-CoA thioester hydrolase
VIEARCTYHESARYDDEIEVRTTSTLESPIRIQFLYEVVRAADGTKLATGMTMHAALDRTGRPRRLPDRVRTMFA